MALPSLIGRQPTSSATVEARFFAHTEETDAQLTTLAGLFGDVRSVVAAAATGQGCDLGQQALIIPRLVNSVLRPVAEALAALPGGPGSPVPAQAVPMQAMPTQAGPTQAEADAGGG